MTASSRRPASTDPKTPNGPLTGRPVRPTQKPQSSGASGHSGSGSQPGGGRHPSVGRSGHSGGGLNRYTGGPSQIPQSICAVEPNCLTDQRPGAPKVTTKSS